MAAALLDSQQAWSPAQDVLKNKTVSILVWREKGLAPVANEERQTTEGQSERESVLVRVSVVVIKHHERKQLEEEGSVSAYSLMSQSIVRGSQGRNARQTLKQRPQRSADYWLALRGFSLLSVTTRDQGEAMVVGWLYA